MTTGSANVILGAFSGNNAGLDIRTANNHVVLSDGDGNPRGIFDGSGNFLVGTTATINSGLGVFSKANSNQLVINSSNSNGGSLDFCNGGAAADARIGGLTTGTATALQVQVGAAGGVQLASGASAWASMAIHHRITHSTYRSPRRSKLNGKSNHSTRNRTTLQRRNGLCKPYQRRTARRYVRRRLGRHSVS
jgi:hypothetical protein